MATLKHIASKNSDYTAIEAYLVYQHDAFTGKQLLDEQGRPKLRESYILDTLEFNASSTPVQSMEIFLPSRSSSSTQPVSMLNLQALSSYFTFMSS